MLTKKQKDRIIELWEPGYSQRYIRKDTGHALQTISNVIKEYKKRKLDEIKQKNKEIAEIKEGQIINGVGSFDSTIDGVRALVASISNIIKKGHMKAKEREEWGRYLEDLQELLRFDVDEKIVAERADAVDLRDEQWRRILNQSYVKKEVATDLGNTIISKDVAIDNLENIVSEKDDLLRNKDYEISQVKDSDLVIIEDLKSQIRKLSWDLQGFIEENWRMYNTILGYQYYYDQREQEFLKREQGFMDKELKIENSLVEVDKKNKLIEMRGKYLDEQVAELKKSNEDSNIKEKKILDALNERIKSVENREKNVIILEKILLRQNEEADRERKKIKND